MPRVPHFSKRALVFSFVHLGTVECLEPFNQVILIADLLVRGQSELEFLVDLLDVGMVTPPIEIVPRAVGSVKLAYPLSKLLTLREPVLQSVGVSNRIEASLEYHLGQAPFNSDAVLPVPSIVLEPLPQHVALKVRTVKSALPLNDFLHD